MKAVKRATCRVCKYKTNLSIAADLKADKEGRSVKCKCPNDGTPLSLSSQWYARGEHNGVKIFEPCGPLKKDADAFIATCLLAKRSGSVIPGQEKDISWADAVKNCSGWWDKDVARDDGMKAGTREHYRNQVTVLDRYFFGMSLLTITKNTVVAMMDDMSATYAPATISHAVKALKRVYTMHLENLDLEETPRPKLMEKSFIINKAKLPVVDNEKTVACDSVDMHTVLAAIQNGKGPEISKQRLRLAIMLGVGMLMRPININSLEWSEIDFDSAVVRIPKAKMKGGRDFEKAVPSQILDELRAWRLKIGLASRYVFPAPFNPKKPDQGDVPMQRMSKAITTWIKKVGLNPEGVDRKEKITPYVLTRHTGATQLYQESGENLEMVSKTADHADSRITRKRYVKNNIDFEKRTVVPIQEAMIRRMMEAA
jgi:integrase